MPKGKVKVVFDLTPQQLRYLLEYGTKADETEDQISEIIDRGKATASDYLTDSESQRIWGLLYGLRLGESGESRTSKYAHWKMIDLEEGGINQRKK